MANNKPIIFVLGGPGCGKGTQCERIVHDFGFLHLSAGDLLRDEVKRKSELGKKCEQLMKDGKLVPADVPLSLLSKAMKDANNAKGYLIDGFPRALDQAQAFDKLVGRPTLVIFLECPQDVMEKRLLKRGETSGRSDDNLNTIIKRFETFQKESLPVIAFYRKLKAGLVLQQSSVPPPDMVYKEMELIIRKAITPVISTSDAYSQCSLWPGPDCPNLLNMDDPI
ncbi:unnamed protein product [Sphagnum balticum]